MRTVLVLFLLLVSSLTLPAQEAIEYGKVSAVVAGVLSWQDRGLSTYSPCNRKDLELFRLLRTKGMPEKSGTLLLDNAATRAGVTAALRKAVAATGPDTVLLFYYAGHGLKRGDKTFFANYDISAAQPEQTGLDLLALARIIADGFKGRLVILLADCCYSGGLKQAAALIAAKGKAAVSLTSADASNASTGNWTFTQAIIDSLSGLSLADHDRDGHISLAETAREVGRAMRYRERQRHGYGSWNTADTLVLSRTVSGPHPAPHHGYALGDYALVNTGNKWETARLTGLTNAGASCELYHYSDKKTVFLSWDRVKKITFKSHPAGSTVDVLWGGTWYRAKILKVEDGFHWITYPGWPSVWDEWVMDDRIRTTTASGPAKKTVLVEWKGTWYPAEVLKTEGGKFYIHYLGFGAEWDEWVTANRVRQRQ
jgi:hypothetical protein